MAAEDQIKPEPDSPSVAKGDGQVAPKTDDIDQIAPLSGVDRSGLGDKGWAEVPADLIGGHPELDSAPRSGPEGGINGPQPDIDPRTGAPRQSN